MATDPLPHASLGVSPAVTDLPRPPDGKRRAQAVWDRLFPASAAAFGPGQAQPPPPPPPVFEPDPLFPGSLTGPGAVEAEAAKAAAAIVQWGGGQRLMSSVRGLVTTRASAAEPPASRSTGPSHNWCGVYAVPHDGERFTEVWGHWTSPSPRMVQGSGQPQVCSVWIGLDGLRRHAGSMPQVGTIHGFDATGAAVCHAWHQWWVRGEEHPPVRIASVPVAPGDDLVACLRRIDGGRAVEIRIRNATTGAAAFYTLAAPAGAPPAGGTSAQWIVEPPTKMGSNELMTLPDFGEVTFTGWAADGDRRLGEDRLVRPLRLFARQPPPPGLPARIDHVAAPSLRRRPDAGVTVRYGR
jgi:hypothetical protein